MMVIPVNVAAVSYLNTVPFIYGIRHAENLRAELLLSPPSGCAEAFLNKQVDVALVPIGALPLFDDAQIITNFCIGAEKSVRTVTLMSNTPIRDVRKIWLDKDSRTSVLLTRILAKEYWNIAPEWDDWSDRKQIDDPTDGEAYLLIGDKVFDYETRFKYVYDLADCWRELTDKPMVFAVWIARRGISPEVIDSMEEALTMGVERVWEAIVESGHQERPDAYEYLTQNIDFLFDNQKHKALELFWDKGLKIQLHANPG